MSGHRCYVDTAQKLDLLTSENNGASQLMRGQSKLSPVPLLAATIAFIAILLR